MRVFTPCDSAQSEVAGSFGCVHFQLTAAATLLSTELTVRHNNTTVTSHTTENGISPEDGKVNPIT